MIDLFKTLEEALACAAMIAGVVGYWMAIVYLMGLV
jgi:hypothetical protein